MNCLNKISICYVLTLSLLIITSRTAQAGKGDTPDTLMTTYKAGAADTADLLAVSGEANSFVNRIASDKTYATKLLEAIQKNNTTAIVSIVKETAPRSTVQVQKIDPDFTIAVEFTIRGHHVVVCGSSENKCDGQKFLATVS